MHHPEHNAICQFDLRYFMFNYTHTQTHIGKKKKQEKEKPNFTLFYLFSILMHLENVLTWANSRDKSSPLDPKEWRDILNFLQENCMSTTHCNKTWI